MTVVRFKNLNVGRSRPSNKFQTRSIGNENLGYNKEDTWLSILARTCPRKLGQVNGELRHMTISATALCL